MICEECGEEGATMDDCPYARYFGQVRICICCEECRGSCFDST